MNNASSIRLSTLAAAAALIAVASTAAAGPLPAPLGAGHQLLSPGIHVLDLVSREQSASGPRPLPRIAITLPNGWYNYEGWGLNDGGTLIVSFWDVAKVYGTPCRWQTKPKVDPGPSVAGLASTLARQPLRHATRPRNVVLGGFHGKYLSWSVPSKIDFTHCAQGYFESWTAKGWASDRYQQGPGQVDRLWILDVKGQRLVIDAAYMPWATRKQRVELDRIVHSIKFLSNLPRKPRSAATGPAVSSVVVSDINNRGQIIGSFATSGGANRAYVWRNGSLGLLGRGPTVRTVAINERGQVLGVNGYHRNLWENGTIRRIRLHLVWALNDRGQVLGGAVPPGGDYVRDGSIALWSHGRVRLLPLSNDWSAVFNDKGQVAGDTPYGDLLEWDDGIVYDFGPGDPVSINDRGEILGGRNGEVTVWRNGIATDLGPGNPVAINERGEVTWDTRGTGTTSPHAFLWRDGKTIDLGTLGGTFSIPTAISDHGQVVGYSTDGNGVQHGFVWQNGTMTQLPSPKGYGGHQTRAVGINDHNQIVGDGHRGSSVSLYNPPLGPRDAGDSRFAVLWTVRDGTVKTLRLVGPHTRLH